MVPNRRLGAVLDFTGAGGLVAATVALISDRWLSIAPEGALLSTFFWSLTLAVSAFALARVLQIGQLVAQTPARRSVRTEPAATNITAARPVLVTAESAKPGDDLQRAA